ncbi:MAG: MBL fold metallo-hydrolase [Planctomycetota bacterium]
MRFTSWFVGVAVALGLSAVGQAQDDSMRIHFVDAGQANCAILEFSKGVMVVDAGGEVAKPPGTFDGNEKVMTYLKKFFERRTDLAGRRFPIDLLAITHPHKDHTSAIPDVIDKYPPANVIHNHQRTGSGVDEQNIAVDYIRNSDARGYFIVQERAFESVRSTGKGIHNDVIDPFTWPGTHPEVTVLSGGVRNNAGWGEVDFADENNHSLVIRVDFGGASVLFPGDIEEADKKHGPPKKATVERLVDAYANTGVLDVDVYLVSHHASKNGGNDDLLRLISPEIAVISCGPPVAREGSKFSAFNFGHPRKQALDEIEGAMAMTSLRAQPKDIKQFIEIKTPLDRQIKKAIYSTAWDGDIVLEAKASGDWTVKEPVGQ